MVVCTKSMSSEKSIVEMNQFDVSSLDGRVTHIMRRPEPFSTPGSHSFQCLVLYPERRPMPVDSSVDGIAQRQSFAQSTRHEIQLAHTPDCPIPPRPDAPRASRREIIWILVGIQANLI